MEIWKYFPKLHTVLLLGRWGWLPEKCCDSFYPYLWGIVTSTWQEKINIPHYSDSQCHFCVAGYDLQSIHLLMKYFKFWWVIYVCGTNSSWDLPPPSHLICTDLIDHLNRPWKWQDSTIALFQIGWIISYCLYNRTCWIYNLFGFIRIYKDQINIIDPYADL